MVLEFTPNVLSVGRRVVNHGYTFYWPAYSRPYLVHPSGKCLLLEVQDYIPHLTLDCEEVDLPSNLSRDVVHRCQPPGKADEGSTNESATTSNSGQIVGAEVDRSATFEDSSELSTSDDGGFFASLAAAARSRARKEAKWVLRGPTRSPNHRRRSVVGLPSASHIGTRHLIRRGRTRTSSRL